MRPGNQPRIANLVKLNATQTHLDSSSENRRQKEFNNCRAKVRRQGDRRSVEWLCRRDGRRLRACWPVCDGCQGSGESGCWQAGRRAVCERTGKRGGAVEQGAGGRAIGRLVVGIKGS